MGFLEQFSIDEQGALRSCAQTIALGPGAALFRQHDRSRDIYVLEDGVLEVVDTSGSSPIILRTFPKGELVGEISFLHEHARRTAEVRARDAVRLRMPWPVRSACLVLTFLLGPIGFLLHLIARAIKARQVTVDG